MTEEELRIGAIEMLLIEMIPWLDPEAIADARRSIEAGLLDGAGGDEIMMRRQALSLIEDGQKRYADPLAGLIFPKPNR